MDIRIEEGWDKEAFEHRGWMNWNWLRAHYGGERHRHNAGNNRVQLGFEPTLRHMMAEMLRTKQATPDEIYSALNALVRKNEPLHEGDGFVRENQKSADSLAHNEAEDSTADGGTRTGRKHLNTRQGTDKFRVPDRGPITWRHGRAPWAPSEASPWDRHGRLMNEFENPEDAMSAEISSHEVERSPRGKDHTNIGVDSRRGWISATERRPAAEDELSDRVGAPHWSPEGRPIDSNRGRRNPFVEAIVNHQWSRKSSLDRGKSYGKPPSQDLSNQNKHKIQYNNKEQQNIKYKNKEMSHRKSPHLKSADRKSLNENHSEDRTSTRDASNRMSSILRRFLRKPTRNKPSEWRTAVFGSRTGSDVGIRPNRPRLRTTASSSLRRKRRPDTRSAGRKGTRRHEINYTGRKRRKQIPRCDGRHSNNVRMRLASVGRKDNSLAPLVGESESRKDSTRKISPL